MTAGQQQYTQRLLVFLQLKLIKACSTDELFALGLQAPSPPVPAAVLNDSQQPVAAQLQAVQVRSIRTYSNRAVMVSCNVCVGYQPAGHFSKGMMQDGIITQS